MKRYIENFKKYRFLLTELVKKNIKLKYRKSKLGILWTLIEPLLTMLVLTLVFANMMGREGDFSIYILTGRLMYGFFSNATKQASKSVRSNSGMMRKVYVPKYMYPLASVLSNFIMFLISLIILVGVAAYWSYKGKITITWHVVESILPMFVLFLMALGVGIILATLEVFFRDLEYLWGVVLMLIMYCCAIFYPASKLENAGVGWILDINPLYAMIRNFRNCIVFGQGLHWPSMCYGLAFSLVSIVIGVYIFCKKQDEFILHL